MIHVAGVEVPRSALSELALRLNEAGEYSLATRLGRAMDSGSTTIALAPRDEAELLDALERHSVFGLDSLSLELLERARARARV